MLDKMGTNQKSCSLISGRWRVKDWEGKGWGPRLKRQCITLVTVNLSPGSDSSSAPSDRFSSAPRYGFTTIADEQCFIVKQRHLNHGQQLSSNRYVLCREETAVEDGKRRWKFFSLCTGFVAFWSSETGVYMAIDRFFQPPCTVVESTSTVR